MQELVIGGIYEHYKGKKYFVLNLAKHSETMEDLVVYIHLYDHDGGNPLWVRPLKMFLEDVTIDGKTVPRFKLVDNPSKTI